MKNFKKRMLAGLLAVAMAATTFANVTPVEAKSLTAKQYLTKMEKAVAKAKSYKSKTTAISNVCMEGQNVNSKTVTTTTMFTNPVKVKSVATTTLTGDVESKTKSISYMKQNSKGKVLMYTSADGGKTYDKTDVTDIMDLSGDVDASAYKKAKIAKKTVKVNKINTVKITAQMSSDDLEDVLNSMGLNGEESEEMIDLSEIPAIKVTLWIDKKTYYPVKIQTDTTAFMNGLMKQVYAAMGEELTEDVYSKVTSVAEYSKFNSAAKFSLPKACK